MNFFQCILDEYSKEPKRDQTIKQLALAKAQHKINELCTVSLEKNKQLKLTLSDGTVLLIESEKVYSVVCVFLLLLLYGYVCDSF